MLKLITPELTMPVKDIELFHRPITSHHESIGNEFI